MQCRGVLQVVDIPVVTQRLIPMVRVTIEISQFRVDKVVDALFYAGRAGFSRCPLCATTGAFRRCSSSTRSSSSLSWRRGTSHDQAVHQTMRFPCCRTHGG